MEECREQKGSGELCPGLDSSIQAVSRENPNSDYAKIELMPQKKSAKTGRFPGTVRIVNLG
jgi:hypothetical protein